MSRTIWILGDQLAMDHPALAAATRGDARVLMIESRVRGSAQRYHKLKLVLVYSAMRHHAAALRQAGWTVDYYPLEQGHTFESAWRDHLSRQRSAGRSTARARHRVAMVEPHSFAETDAVHELAATLDLDVEFHASSQFLITRTDFRDWAAGQKRLLMGHHYRRMRQRFGWLMQADGTPAGGAWNFDAENRATFNQWKKAGAPRAHTAPSETPDAITREVMTLVARDFADHPGDVATFWLPVDRTGAERWLARFVRESLPRFGTFEDMMSAEEPFLFHSVLSPLINLGLLSPRECVEAAMAAYEAGAVPLNSAEGYLRQVIGWREFINGVYWLRGPEYSQLNELQAHRPLPSWFCDGQTNMNCLHQVLRQTVELGWNHHIQRLMVLANFCLIAGINPQQALRWFQEMYVDAFDWVMAANVIGMALHADGGFMATKPYAATSTYIRKMSNYCQVCRYDPDEKVGADACPFNYLYWDFIDRHEARFSRNMRMLPIVRSWQARPAAGQDEVRSSAAAFLGEHVPA